jgi:DNA-binding SARP family transcriptional activator/tetratricopeptide (TPR) repeat protein
MLFRVLGSLETRSTGDAPVRLGAAKHRLLLAILLLEANQPVHAGRIVTALWPGRPPPSAAAVLRTYVSALRRSLGLARTGGPAALLSVPGGYRLQVEPGDLDLSVFTDLCRRGRQALADGDVVSAATLLRGALDLWRGAPLEDVPLDGEWIARLDEVEEQRLAAVEAWAEAVLATGRHDDVAAELRPVVAAHPLRERLCEHWMLALYRAGRQAEAFAAYQRLRVEMVAELGVEPGPALVRLRQRILDVDPALRLPGGRTLPIVPRQLPPDILEFTGRGAEIERLESVLTNTSGAVAIAAACGPGGIGKSALAVRVGHRLADRFPDGQLYVDLRGAGPAPLRPMAVLGTMLRALGMSGDEIPDTLAEAAAAFRALTADSRLLVLLDNAGDVAQVRPLLPAGAGCAVLVTSRQVLATLDGATHLQLEVLARHESLALLDKLVGAGRVTADTEGARRLADLCGHLPLALRIAAARLAARPSWPAGELAARLGDATRRLDELQFADLGVRASFQVSYQSLADEELVAAYPLLSVLDVPDLSLPVAARLLDRDERRTERLLERLVDAQLLETPAPHRYRLHDLLRLFARELAEQSHTSAERTAAVARAVDWYTATVWRTFRLLRPGDTRERLSEDGGMRFADASAALAWLEAERANLVAAVRQESSVDLAQALFGFFQVHSHWHDLIGVNQAALAEARRTGDLAAQAQACCDLNVAYDAQGRYEDAIRFLTEGLRIFRLLGDERGQAACLNGLGVVYDSQQRYAEAKACLEESLEVRQQTGDRFGQALSLNNLGVVHKRLDHHTEALRCYERALTICEQIGDHRMEAGLLTNVGEVYERQGRDTEALACHERSMRLFRRLGDRQGQALNLGNRSRLYQHRGNYREARTCLEECLAIHSELGDRRGQAECLHQLGELLDQQGHTTEAHARWQDALTIFTDLRLPTANKLRTTLSTPTQDTKN